MTGAGMAGAWPVLAATLGLSAACWVVAARLMDGMDDVPLALAIAGLGLVILIAPSVVPGIAPPAM
jgi:hypothetical protein